MARRRMIDPNIWQSEDFANISTLAKLVFIGLFSNADDEGRGRAKPAYIRNILFPYDDGMRIIDIEKALSEIGQNMSVTFYDHDGSQYYVLDNWLDWQTIDKPKPSKLPPPPPTLPIIKDCRGHVGDESTTRSGSVGDASRLREEKGKEEKGNTPSNCPPRNFTPPTVDEVRAYCQERGNKVNPQGFVDFYASKGWLVGRSKMKDWEAAVRTWEQRDDTRAPAQKKASRAQNHSTRQYADINCVGSRDLLAAEEDL